jgi:hypothetical protein
MRIINWSLVIGLTALASGCATTKQVTEAYWTEKSGIAVVHHVSGKVDSIEKLSEKPLTSDEVDAANLPKGKYFKVVESHVDAPVKPIKANDSNPKKDAKKDSDGSKLEEVTSQLHDLKGQVAAVAAQNKRLQEQINSSPAPQPTQPEPQQEADAPRISQ